MYFLYFSDFSYYSYFWHFCYFLTRGSPMMTEDDDECSNALEIGGAYLSNGAE
jgi:hypothetical protein